MRTCEEFLKILDDYLKTKNLSRRQFCILTDIPTTTLSSWKSKNLLPSVEFVAKIAKFMNVSLDWLVNGEITDNSDNTLENPCSRKSIVYRIEIVTRQKFNDFDYDPESLHKKYLSDIVDYELLTNWELGKANISENVLPAIAKKLDVSLQWLLTKEEYHVDITEYEVQLAMKYQGLLKGYNCLDEEDQKFIDHYILSRLEVQNLKNQTKDKKND